MYIVIKKRQLRNEKLFSWRSKVSYLSATVKIIEIKIGTGYPRNKFILKKYTNGVKSCN